MDETTKANDERSFPWNKHMSQAQQGDSGAILLCCQAAEPVVADFCRNSTFLGLFSADEVRSIACLAALEFMMEYSGQVPDREIPWLLRRIIRCRLYDEARRLQTRLRYELQEPECPSNDEKDEERFPDLQVAAPEEERPEAQLLQADLRHRIKASLSALKPKEQELIRAMYMENMTSAEIAKKWQCSSRYVLMVKRDALNHLKILLHGTE